MNIHETLSLNIAIQRLQAEGVPRPVKFGYALAINGRRLKDIVDSYEESRQLLLQKFGKVDELGNLVVNDGNAVVDDIDGFNQAYLDLQTTEVTVQLHKVKLDDLPSELDAAIVNAMLPMIAE